MIYKLKKKKNKKNSTAFQGLALEMPGNKSLLISTVSSPQEFVQAALHYTLWAACRVVTIPHHLLMYFLLLLNSSGNRNCLLPSSKGLEPSFGMEAHGGEMRAAPFLPCCHKHKQLWGTFSDRSKYPKAHRHSPICFHLQRCFFNHHHYFRHISFGEHPFIV